MPKDSRFGFYRVLSWHVRQTCQAEDKARILERAVRFSVTFRCPWGVLRYQTLSLDLSTATSCMIDAFNIRCGNEKLTPARIF